MLTFQDVLLCHGHQVHGMEKHHGHLQVKMQGSTPSNMGECVTGCTDANAANHNVDADISDDSCEYAATPGCMDESACNFNSDAQIDDGSCDYPAANYDCEGNCLATAVVAGGGFIQVKCSWDLLTVLEMLY